MKLISTANMEPLTEGSVVCLGFFDGLHKGHMALIMRAKSIAQAKGMTLVVHSFDHSPAKALHPEQRCAELTTLAEKEALLAEAGCEVLAVSPFDEKMRRMSGREFFEEIVLKKLNAKAVVAGYDHRFGYRGDTDSDKLIALCEEHQVILEIVQKVTLANGEVISSTAVRRALAEGNLPLAEQMLGRHVDQNMILRCGTQPERQEERV